MSDYRERFFEGVKEQSQIKLRAFDRYLVPWATKVGSRRGMDRLWVVDGFAGAGRYDTGELGSAGLALERARAMLGKQGRARRRVSVFFTERSRENYRRLSSLRAQYPEVEGFVEHWDFWEKIDRIVDVVNPDPVFLFVDPFGLGDLKFDPLVRLCRALRTVDVMVNFASPVARRLAPGQPQLVDEAVGGAGWDLDSLGDVFCERLQAECGLLKPARLPVLGALGDMKYELVMGARNAAAYELWNDEIADRDRVLLDVGSPDEVESRIEDAAEMLKQVARNVFVFDRRTLLSRVRTQFCGEAHTRVYIRAVQRLVESGIWGREDGPIDRAVMRWRSG